MRVHIGTDHAAFELKEFLVAGLRQKGHEVVDHGAFEYDAQDDYPATIIPCAEGVAGDPGSLGIVLGGSGNGENIAANKVKGVRCALAYRPELAQLGRQHNDANVVAMGGRFLTNEEAMAIALAFLETPFSGEARHQRRIDMLTSYEQTGSISVRSDMGAEQKVVSATRTVGAPAATLFELIADPARQPEWDGNDNLAVAEPGQRVRRVDDVFVMRTTKGAVRENHVVEFDEGRLIAWRPSEVGKEPPGHLWRWELEPIDDGTTRVTHTYDWTQLTGQKRVDRARWTTSERLLASVDRLAELAERESAG